MIKTVTQLQLPIQNPHKIRTPKPGNSKGRKVLMGTRLPLLQKGRRRLGWQPPRPIPAERYTADEFLPGSEHETDHTSNSPANPDTML